MSRPVLSPNFTIEDIHKLREYNYYQTKDMSRQERMDYYNTRGMEVHKDPQCNSPIAVLGSEEFKQSLPTVTQPYGTTIRAYLQKFL